MNLTLKQSSKIHERIWKTYDNEIIYQTLVKANERISLFVGSFTDNYYPPHVIKKSYRDHFRLMETIKKRDSKLAERALTTHWDISKLRNNKQKGGVIRKKK